MVSSIDESLQDCKQGITRIFHPDGKNVAGQGFLVSDRYVITCAHVVHQVLGEEKVNQLLKELKSRQDIPSNQDYSIKLDFCLIYSTEKTIEAEVVLYLYKQNEEIEDIAVLKLKDEPPKEAQPVQLNRERNLWGHPCKIYGCPRRREQGVWIKSEILEQVADGTIQIEGTKEAGYPVERGFSGAPVWDKELEGVVGMVVKADTDERVKAAYMIPTNIIKEKIKEFFPEQSDNSKEKIDIHEEDDYSNILKDIEDIARGLGWSGVVPFLGSGVNLCYRPKTFDPRHPGQYPPTEIELVSHLAEVSGGSLEELMGVPCAVCPYIPDKIPDPSQCPLVQRMRNDGGDLVECPLFKQQRLAVAKVGLRSLSQYFKNKQSIRALYNALRPLLKGDDYQPNKLHHFFTKFSPDLLPLIVTTNFDDMLEYSFGTKEFDVIYYVAEGNKETIGKYIHRFPNGTEKIISDPANYDEIPINKRPVILKLYGTWNQDFAITKDHYVNYMAGNPIKKLLPGNLLNILQEASILFLGYSLSDFDLDIILRRFWESRQFPGGWIVHQSQPGDLERKFWKGRDRDVTSLKIPLDRFINKLQEKL